MSSCESIRSYNIKKSPEVEPITKKILREKIYSLQNPWFIRYPINFYNFLRSTLNFGLNAAISIANDAFTRHLGALPTASAIHKEYFKELDVETDLTFNSDKEKRELRALINLCEIIKRCGYNRVVLQIDKLDEESRLENDAENIADFASNIVTDNILLLSKDLQFLVFMWTVPYNYLKEKVRTQKLSVQKLEWMDGDLKIF